MARPRLDEQERRARTVGVRVTELRELNRICRGESESNGACFPRCLHHQPRLDRLQRVENPLDHVFLSAKQCLRPPGVQLAEGRFVESRCLHNASGRELVDHHLDEADLRWREALVGEEAGEGALRRGAIHPHHVPNEVGQRGLLATGQEARQQRLAVVLADLRQGPLQSQQIGRGERLVGS